METQLVQYVKNRQGKQVGCVIAKSFPGLNGIYVSGSLCNIKKDIFTKKDALALAEGRTIAMAFQNRYCPLPYSLTNDINHMTNRARKYYKGRPIITSTIKKP